MPVELQWVKLGWVVEAAKAAGVDFQLHHSTCLGTFFFRMSHAERGVFIGDGATFEKAVDDALTWLNGFKKSA